MENTLEVLKSEQLTVVDQAAAIAITDPASHTEAAGFLTQIKGVMKKMTDYWSAPKAAAYAAWKEICGKETEMLKPLQDAESIVKNKIGAYVTEQRRIQQAAEEAARRQQAEEAERLAREAEKAENMGDTLGAELLLSAAVNAEQGVAISAPAAPPKTAGVSVRTVWKARVIDAAKVPVSMNGMVIRPIDTAALDAFARLTKGQGTIPGVVFFEEPIVSARGR